MKPTIELLWNGQINPGEKCGINDPEIDNLIELLDKNKEILEAELPPQQKKRFSIYSDCTDEYISLISMHSFCEGFSLAAKLFSEAFS